MTPPPANDAFSSEIITEAVSDAERNFSDAANVPALAGSGELPSQAAADAVLEAASNSRLVREKSVSGAKSLGLRTVVSFSLRVVSSLTLSHFLFPKNYGIFGAASGIAGLGQYFCDVGMGSVLVMQEREPTEDEITTIFWLQQFVTTVVVLVLLLSVPLLLSLFKVEAAAGPILVVMSLGLFPASLRVVPVMRLERGLEFGQQAKAEMVENFSQVIVNLSMAVAGFGTWALVGGAVTARIVGLVAIWKISPWRPRGKFRLEMVKRFIGKGTLFQLCTIVPVALGTFCPIIISRELGVSALGLLNWSANLASIPLMLHGILNRIAFPALSRLQSNPAEVGRVTGILVRRVTTTLSVCFAPVVILGPLFIPLVFGQRWVLAIPLFQWAIMDTINFISVALIAAALGGGAGQVGLRLIASVFGGLMKIALLFGAIWLFGLVGAGIGNFGGTLCELALLTVFARKHIKGSQSLVGDILSPLIGIQGSAALGLAVSYFLFGGNRSAAAHATLGHVFLSSAAALGVFLVGLTIYDSLGTKGAVRTEILGIARLLQTRGETTEAAA